MNSISSHALTGFDGTSTLGGLTSGIGGLSSISAAAAAVAAAAASNVSPLPIRAHQMSTMPPLCQV